MPSRLLLQQLGPARLAELRAAWLDPDSDTLALVAHYGLGARWRLYKIAHLLGWPARAGGRKAGSNRTVHIAPARLAEAHVAYLAGEPMKRVAALLGVKNRDAAYYIAYREGWPMRRSGRPGRPRKRTGAREAVKPKGYKRAIQKALADIRNGVPGPELPRVARARAAEQRRRAEPPVPVIPSPAPVLGHVCAACGYRVGDGYGAVVDGQLYHQAHAPSREQAA